DPLPSVRITRGAGSGQYLASVLQEGRENTNIDASLGFIWRISEMNRKQRRAAKQPHAELASAFSQALALHQAGRLAEAEKIYGQILKVQPNHFDSLHLVGVIYAQRGNPVESVRQIDLALKINPKAAHAHNNRGNVLRELKRLDEALASYDRAL